MSSPLPFDELLAKSPTLDQCLTHLIQKRILPDDAPASEPGPRLSEVLAGFPEKDRPFMAMIAELTPDELAETSPGPRGGVRTVRRPGPARSPGSAHRSQPVTAPGCGVESSRTSRSPRPYGQGVASPAASPARPRPAPVNRGQGFGTPHPSGSEFRVAVGRHRRTAAPRYLRTGPGSFPTALVHGPGPGRSVNVLRPVDGSFLPNCDRAVWQLRPANGYRGPG